MPDEKPKLPSEIAAEQAAAAAAASTPEYVTRAELASMSEGLVGRIQGLLEGAARGQTVEQPRAAAIPVVDLAELDEIVKDGKEGAGAKIAALVEAKVTAALGAYHRAEVEPIRTHGLSSLAAIAKTNALSTRKHAKRYEREIDDFMKAAGDEVKGNPDAWGRVYEAVVGRHQEELEREAVEAALRSDGETRAAAPPPGSGPLVDEDGRRLPSAEEFAGAEGLQALREKGITDPNDWAKRAGYDSWRDFVKMAAELPDTGVPIDEYSTPRQRAGKRSHARI